MLRITARIRVRKYGVQRRLYAGPRNGGRFFNSLAFSGSELTTVAAKMIIYQAVIESELEVPKHLARTVHDHYFCKAGALANQRPNQILPDPLCANPGPNCWINPAAFALPALGTLGNMGKYNVIGPGFWQLDTSLSRIFAVRESLPWRSAAKPLI
ncbi:MAG TPA: hypothetical protein VIY49_18425 [Bryobacteraceae bacterium]